MNKSIVLPAEFVDLQPFAARWGQRSTDARHHQRQNSSLDEIKEFYEAMQPRLAAVFDYLDQFEPATMPPSAQHLLNLSFGFIEASLAVEIFKSPGIAKTSYPHGFTVLQELL